MQNNVFRIAVPLLMAFALSACAGAVVGGGAAVGVAAFEERGIDGKAKDLKVQAGIFENWLRYDHSLSAYATIEVWEGRALLTGVAKDEATRAEMVKMAWAVEGVREVLNELQLESGGFIDYTHDAAITTKLTSRITFDKTILSINYYVKTVSGVVYLIGIAQDQGELDRVLAHARDITYVKRVVNHVRLKGNKPS
ncbi:MAG: BON domain-containing protein [Magnetospirillum sp. WYHS-4]